MVAAGFSKWRSRIGELFNRSKWLIWINCWIKAVPVLEYWHRMTVDVISEVSPAASMRWLISLLRRIPLRGWRDNTAYLLSFLARDILECGQANINFSHKFGRISASMFSSSTWAKFFSLITAITSIFFAEPTSNVWFDFCVRGFHGRSFPPTRLLRLLLVVHVPFVHYESPKSLFFGRSLRWLLLRSFAFHPALKYRMKTFRNALPAKCHTQKHRTIFEQNDTRTQRKPSVPALTRFHSLSHGGLAPPKIHGKISDSLSLKQQCSLSLLSVLHWRKHSPYWYHLRPDTKITRILLRRCYC